jgi:hypothetical protein
MATEQPADSQVAAADNAGPPGETPETDQELALQRSEPVGIDPPVSIDHHIQGLIELVQVLPEDFPEHTLDPVPSDGVPDLPRNGDAESGTALLVQEPEHGE